MVEDGDVLKGGNSRVSVGCCYENFVKFNPRPRIFILNQNNFPFVVGFNKNSGVRHHPPYAPVPVRIYESVWWFDRGLISITVQVAAATPAVGVAILNSCYCYGHQFLHYAPINRNEKLNNALTPPVNNKRLMASTTPLSKLNFPALLDDISQKKS